MHRTDDRNRADWLSRRRPPPDYTQRRVKMRLFTYLAALMLVLAVIERARDPAAWQWLWSLEKQQAPEPHAKRLEDRPLRTAGDAVDTFIAVDETSNSPGKADGDDEARWKQEWRRVEDDTVFRPAEREIWFHELARVRDADPNQLRQQSIGRVAYLQLFKQPSDYRAEVVTIAGTVKLAYRVAATDNDLGIKEYFVYWVFPAGGPSSPIVVYALEAPAGFPRIKDKDIDGATTKLHEDVEVIGVFFKRWAYAAQDGTYSAPLIVARSPDWRPAAAARPAANLPAPIEFIAIAIGALLIAVCITAVLWKRTSRPAVQHDQRAADMAALASAKLRPSANEALRELERQARAQG